MLVSLETLAAYSKNYNRCCTANVWRRHGTEEKVGIIITYIFLLLFISLSLSIHLILLYAKYNKNNILLLKFANQPQPTSPIPNTVLLLLNYYTLITHQHRVTLSRWRSFVSYCTVSRCQNTLANQFYYSCLLKKVLFAISLYNSIHPCFVCIFLLQVGMANLIILTYLE